MSEKEIFDKLLVILKDVKDDDSFNYSTITESTNFLTELGLDSISLLYMVMSIQNEFGIKIRNEELMKMSLVSDLIAYIKNAK